MTTEDLKHHPHTKHDGSWWENDARGIPPMTTPSPIGAFTVTTEISEKRVADLLCEGFEGGVGYWCRIFDYRAPGVLIAHLATLDDPHVYKHVDYPLCPGGAALCYETEVDGNSDERFEDDPAGLLVLDRAAIERGLALMPKVAPRHWGNFLSENDDAETGDVFIQLCLLGEVRYG